ncbi:MAG: hypothetical protein H7Y08_00410 [Rhizobiaceae bacterium]|nr:hypothetical protein [Rhizobiaceae bacterium]
MTATTSHRIVAGLALVLFGSSAAQAADAQAFGDRLKEIAAKSGVPMAFTAAEAEGENVVLTGVTLGTAPDTAEVGDLTFETVTGSNAEGWRVATVPFEDFSKTEDGKQANVTGMVLEGLQIAGSQGASTLPGETQFFFDKAAVESVSVSEGGKDIFSLSGTEFTNSVASGSGTIASTFNMGDFAVDFAALPADETTKAMQEIGYPQLSGTGSMEMTWNPQSGELVLDPLAISVENAGDFSIDYQINGYTPAFAKSLAEIQEQMAANPDAAQSSGMAIIGLVSQLSVASLSIDFTDASLTPKLLDYYAKQQGQTRDELVAGLTGMMPMVLASLQNPEFQAQVTSAVETFLKDPKSLSVSIDPDAPVAATQIIGAAMGAPQTLPTVLQLEVTANGTE